MFFIQISWLMERNFKKIPLTISTSSPTALQPSAGYNRDDTSTDENEDEEDRFSSFDDINHKQLEEHIDVSNILNSRIENENSKFLLEMKREREQEDHITSREIHIKRFYQPFPRHVFQVKAEKQEKSPNDFARHKFYRKAVFPSGVQDRKLSSNAADLESSPGTSRQHQSTNGERFSNHSDDFIAEERHLSNTVKSANSLMEKEEIQSDEKRLSTQFKPPSLVRRFLEREFPGFSDQERLSEQDNRSATEKKISPSSKKSENSLISTQLDTQSVENEPELMNTSESIENVSDGDDIFAVERQSTPNEQNAARSRLRSPKKIATAVKNVSGVKKVSAQDGTGSFREGAQRISMIDLEQVRESEQRTLFDLLQSERILAAKQRQSKIEINQPQYSLIQDPDHSLAQEVIIPRPFSKVKVFDVKRAKEPKQPFVNLLNKNPDVVKNSKPAGIDGNLRTKQSRVTDSPYQTYQNKSYIPAQGPRDEQLRRKDSFELYDVGSPISKPVEYFHPIDFSRVSQMPTDSSELAALMTSESNDLLEFSSPTLIMDHPDYHEISEVTMSESEFQDTSTSGNLVPLDEHDRQMLRDYFNRRQAHDKLHDDDNYRLPHAYDQYGHPLRFDENGRPRAYDEYGHLLPLDNFGRPRAFDEQGRPLQYNPAGRLQAYVERRPPQLYDEQRPLYRFDEFDRHRSPYRPRAYDDYLRQREYDEYGPRRRRTKEAEDRDARQEPEVIKEVTYFMKPRKIAKRNLRYLQGGESDQDLLDAVIPFRKRKYGLGGRYSPLAVSVDDSYIDVLNRPLKRGQYQMTEPLARKKYVETRGVDQEEISPANILPHKVVASDLPPLEATSAQIPAEKVEKLRKDGKSDEKITEPGPAIFVQPAVAPSVDHASRFSGEGILPKIRDKLKKEELSTHPYEQQIPDSTPTALMGEEGGEYEVLSDYAEELPPTVKHRGIMKTQPSVFPTENEMVAQPDTVKQERDTFADKKSVAARQLLKQMLKRETGEEKRGADEQVYLKDGRRILKLTEKEKSRLHLRKPKKKTKLDLDHVEGLEVKDLIELFKTESEIDYFLKHGEFRPDKQQLLKEAKSKAAKPLVLPRDSFTIVRVSTVACIQ